jgi:hypothetical protein
VFLSARDEAAIFVRDINGVPGMLVNLNVIPTMQKMEGVDQTMRYLRDIFAHPERRPFPKIRLKPILAKAF